MLLLEVLSSCITNLYHKNLNTYIHSYKTKEQENREQENKEQEILEAQHGHLLENCVLSWYNYYCLLNKTTVLWPILFNEHFRNTRYFFGTLLRVLELDKTSVFMEFQAI